MTINVSNEIKETNYFSDSKPTKDIATVVTVRSSGPVAEMYPESLGQYNIIRDVFRNDHPVYKHVDRDDRFIVYYGNIEYIHFNNIVSIFTYF